MALTTAASIRTAETSSKVFTQTFIFNLFRSSLGIAGSFAGALKSNGRQYMTFAPPWATTIVATQLAVAPYTSVTWQVKVYDPVAVIVPLITPVLPARERPGGRLPEVMAKVYGGLPPLATNKPS